MKLNILWYIVPMNEHAVKTFVPSKIAEVMNLPADTALLCGQGNNAVVLHFPGAKEVVKFYGSNQLTSPDTFARIEQHFASEIIAMQQVGGLGGRAPVLIDHGRLHPSVSGIHGWHLEQVYGWLRMTHLEGVSQDKLALDAGRKFTDAQKNDPFYYSVGFLLGQLHVAGRPINHDKIHHNHHESQREYIERFFFYA